MTDCRNCDGLGYYPWPESPDLALRMARTGWDGDPCERCHGRGMEPCEVCMEDPEQYPPDHEWDGMEVCEGCWTEAVHAGHRGLSPALPEPCGR